MFPAGSVPYGIPSKGVGCLLSPRFQSPRLAGPVVGWNPSRKEVLVREVRGAGACETWPGCGVGSCCQKWDHPKWHPGSWVAERVLGKLCSRCWSGQQPGPDHPDI